MKTLVIHPQDNTTKFLSVIYENKDWTVIDYNPSKSSLKKSIKEHDRIVMLGHGTQEGLLGFNCYVINSDLVYLLREKLCVCIWCNADIFVQKYNLKGFYTGMFISEYEEALNYCISTNMFYLHESNNDFAVAVSESIDGDNFLENVLDKYEGNNAVVNFNKKRLYFI